MSRNPNVTILTKEQYETAKKNGINRATTCSRVRDLKWSVEDAITKPVKKKVVFTDEELAIMKKNKLRKSTVDCRIRTLKWDRERALTEPVPYRILH
ncbi:hypothetical protein MPH47_06185 [Psychrobacillus psychrodurans]|uniref:hypothetical protein n=1 Tax=Psychrobacillus psychrodurans TaxID=126157 RepID=UPI001F4D9CC7|nr:hypothetical protein [Psychrobacillus psychrodurans]MCK1996819.1 hypothetical protein [Psychrobacillus psychrodurans]